MIGTPACGQELPSVLLFQCAVIDSPAAIDVDSLAGEPGLLQAKALDFGSLTGLISAHARCIVHPGLVVVNRS